MIAWSVDAANRSRYLDAVAVSSDDEDILAAAAAAGANTLVRRPGHLATDTAPVQGALLHAAESIDRPFDYLVLLPATSPLRQSIDIDACIEACHPAAPAAVTVTEMQKPAEWFCRLDPDGRLVPLIDGDGLRTRRQDLSPAYQPNGAVYVTQSQWFRVHKTFYDNATVGSIMPSVRSVDIDTEMDLMMARWMIESGLATTEAPIS